jgi:hypothetical protein
MTHVFNIHTNNPFRWDSDFWNRSDILLKHYEDVSASLRTCVNQGYIKGNAATLYQNLPTQNQMLLATSPNAYEQLQALKEGISWRRKPGTEHFNTLAIEQLTLYIYAEAHRAGLISETLDHAYWTASRDYVTEIGISPVITLESGIVLDYDSYVHHTKDGIFEPYTYSEAQKLAEFLNQGAALIRLANPCAYSLLTSYTSLIELRKSPQMTGISNSSLDFSIGKLISHNIHLHTTDVTEAMDFLIHESIHQYLFTFEKFFPFFTANPLLQSWTGRRDLYSPWTGNPLDLGSFTHAIIVWYGLFHFWNQLLKSDLFKNDIYLLSCARRRWEAAVGGFIWAKPITKSFGKKEELLPDWFKDLVNQMQDEVSSLSFHVMEGKLA